MISLDIHACTHICTMSGCVASQDVSPSDQSLSRAN